MNESLHTHSQVVDDHFIDLKNKQGVAASHIIHTYNGINWIDLLSAEDAKPLKARANRFPPPSFFSSRAQVTHTTALTRSTCYQLATPSHLIHAPNCCFVFSFPFSHASHTYKGINKIDLPSAEDAKPLKARANRFFFS